MTRINLLKAAFKEGKTVFGTWSMMSSMVAINVIAHSGVDFVIIDLEHGPTSFETVESQLYAAESAGCTPIVRLGCGNEADLLHAMEIGCQSIMVSHVSTPEEAQKIVKACKYPPEGKRGLSPFTRNHGYSDIDLSHKMQRANEEMFVGVLVEGQTGMQNLEKICSTPGLDMVYLGIYDLSSVMGVPGQLTHPKVMDAIQTCVALIRSKGLVAGSVAPNRDYLRMLYDAGFLFISYRADSTILSEGIKMAGSWYRELQNSEQA